MKEPINAMSLDDIGPVPVIVTIPRPDGRSVKVTLKALSEEKIWEIRKSIKWPAPPLKDMSKIGPVYDWTDEKYLLETETASRLQAYKILLACLPFVIPGDNDEARIDYLKNKIGQYAFDPLVRAVRLINIPTEEEIALVARSFRPGDETGPSGNGAAGMDSETVARPDPYVAD